MTSFDLGKWGVSRTGLSWIVIAIGLSSAGCAAATNGNGTGTGGVGSPFGHGGASAPITPSTTGGAGKVGGGASGAAAPMIASGMGGAKSAAGTSASGAGGTTPGMSASGAGGSAGGGTSGTGGATSPPPPASCLDGITDYGNDGPFKFTPMNSGAVNIRVPMVPAGCKVPMIHLANGTGASCGSYAAALDRIATHGFLTLCYEDPNTGAGDQGVMAFDTALKMFPDLADMKFGSTGHSQGGQASFTVLSLAEDKWGDKAIYAGLAMEPASGFGSQPTSGTWQSLYAKIKSPMFMFSGLGTDGLVSQAWVMQAFDALSPTVEAYFWTANGATHIPVPNGEEEEISIPWFRWKLLGDQKACAFFKAIPMTNTKWVEAAVKNAKPCM